jgi:signal peptidase II
VSPARAEDETPAVAPRRRAWRPRVARGGLVAAVALGLLVVDQVSKEWALNRLSGGRIVEAIGSLQFALTWNTGASFSVGSDLELGPYIALLALVVVGWLLWSGHSASRLGAVAAGMVTGGAVGNLIDRALRTGPAGTEVGFMGGAVVDFIDLQWWPIFNVADMGVVGGAVLLVLASIVHGDPKAGQADREQRDDDASAATS